MNIISSLLNWIGTQIGADPSTLTTTSKTIIGSINEINSHAVVEQGTDGIWTYRKWSDGTAECWGKYTFSSTTGSPTYRSVTIDLPSIFIDTPIATTSVGLNNAIGAIDAYTLVSTTKINKTLYSPNNSGNNAGWVYVHAIGKWK